MSWTRRRLQLGLIRANGLGCGIAFFGLLFGILLSMAWEKASGTYPAQSSQVFGATLVMGPMAAGDLLYRLSNGDVEALAIPERGGHICWIPLWVIAGVIWVVALINTVFGTNIR